MNIIATLARRTLFAALSIAAIAAQAFPLLNIQLGAAGSQHRVGPAAVGQTATDFWNLYSRDTATGEIGHLAELHWADNSASSVQLTVENAQGAWGNGTSDAMFGTYLYPLYHFVPNDPFHPNGPTHLANTQGSNVVVTLADVPAGQYDLLVYGHGGPGLNSLNGLYAVDSGTNHFGPLGTATDGTWSDSTWAEGKQYVRFPGLSVGQDHTIRVTALPGAYGLAVISGLQLAAEGDTTPPPAFTNPSTNGPGSLINLQFGAAATAHKAGAAAVGYSNTDVWNFYSRDGAGGYQSSGVLSNLKAADGSSISSTMTISNAAGAWNNGSTDAMYGTYLYPLGGTNTVISIQLSGLDAGVYDLYLYGHAGPNLDAGNSVFKANASRVDYGPAATTSGHGWTSTTWVEGQQYVVLRGIEIEAAGDPLSITVSPGAYPNSFISGLQLARLSGLPGVSTNGPGTNTPITVAAGRLVDVQFAANPVPRKQGFAAVGATSQDYWNFYSRDGVGGLYQTIGSLDDLKFADGSDAGIDLAITNAPGAWGNGVDDSMYGTYLYPFNNSPIYLSLSSVASGTYDLYLYGHGGPGIDSANSVFSATSGSASYGPASTTTSNDWASTSWTEGKQYVVLHGITVDSANPRIDITVAPGQYRQAFLSGLQLVESDTNIIGSLELLPASSLFTNSVDVTINGLHLPAGAEIRFTTDNSEPTIASTIYTGAIHISGVVTIKARGFLSGAPVTGIVARSYLRTDGTFGGIPVAWLIAHFGNGFLNNPNAAPGADADGDGVSNLDEFTAGTDPTDPYSGFKVQAKLVPAVTWNSVVGRRYRILFRPDPASPGWDTIKEVIATEPISHFVDFGITNTSGFYTVVPVNP